MRSGAGPPRHTVAMGPTKWTFGGNTRPASKMRALQTGPLAPALVRFGAAVCRTEKKKKRGLGCLSATAEQIVGIKISRKDSLLGCGNKVKLIALSFGSCGAVCHSSQLPLVLASTAITISRLTSNR